MNRLFVDVDDTLVIVEADGTWHYNERVIESIVDAYYDDKTIIIWSGGGADYALRWKQRLEQYLVLSLERPQFEYMNKDINYPDEQDVCIDDMPIKVRARLVDLTHNSG